MMKDAVEDEKNYDSIYDIDAQIEEEEFHKLRKIGVFGPLQSERAWMERCHAIQRAGGVQNVTQTTDASLYNWLLQQYKRMEKGTIEQDKVQLLEDLGLDDKTFKAVDVFGVRYRVDQLKKFKEQYGHLHITNELDKTELGNFVNRCRHIRTLYNSGATSSQNIEETFFTEELIEELDSLGFGWTQVEARFMRFYNQELILRNITNNDTIAANLTELKDEIIDIPIYLNKEQVAKLRAIGVKAHVRLSPRDRWLHNFKRVKQICIEGPKAPYRFKPGDPLLTTRIAKAAAARRRRAKNKRERRKKKKDSTSISEEDEDGNFDYDGFSDEEEESILYEFVQKCRTQYWERKQGKTRPWLSLEKTAYLNKLGFIWVTKEADDCRSEFRIERTEEKL